MLTQEQINQIRSSSGLPTNTNKENYVGKYDYLKTEEKPGIVKNIVRGVTNPFSRMIATGANVVESTGKLIKGDVAGSKEALEKKRNFGYLGEIEPLKASGENGQLTWKDVKDAGGVALELASTLATPGATSGIAKQGFKAGAVQGLKTGAKFGATTGVVGGTGRGLQNEDKTVGQALVQGAKEGVVGGLAGGALGALSGGVGGAVNKSKALKTKLQLEKELKNTDSTKLLQKNIPDASIADKKLSSTGKIIKDKDALEAIRQGVPEVDVSLIKTASKTDKAKMLEMLSIREAQQANKTITKRSTDVVGDSFLNVTKKVQNANKLAGQQLDDVANTLKGQIVNIDDAIGVLDNDLSSAGIKISPNGKLDFSDSLYRLNPTSQNNLSKFYKEALDLYNNPDAFSVHQTKKLIDEVVDYGKKSEGITGSSEKILKNFRHSLDNTLDENFAKYNQVNTTYSETAGELKKLADSMGRKFRIGDDLADVKMGAKLRGVLSNNQSRADLLQLIDSMEKVAVKNGAKIDDSIVTQANFANMLEDIFGTEAKTGLSSQISQGINDAGQVASAGGDLAKGNLIRGGIKTAKLVYDKTRNVGEKQKLEAIKKLLSSYIK